MSSVDDRLNLYEEIPFDLYILKDDIYQMEVYGSEVQGHFEVDDDSDYEKVSKNSFMPGIKLDENTYLVTLIFK